MKKSKISEEYRKANEKVHAWLLLEWLQDQERGPANTSFTEGPLRVIASAIEQIAKFGTDKDAARYRALRGSLSGLPRSNTTKMPLLYDPIRGPTVTYQPDGLDAAMDEALCHLTKETSP